jgi:hypothetical protein
MLQCGRNKKYKPMLCGSWVLEKTFDYGSKSYKVGFGSI